MADPRLVLKTTPPRAHRTALPRERLARAWEDLRERTAIVVRAKQGFGKTTLLVQWRRQWLEQGALVAWVTLDRDDEPARFALALLHAMRSASGRTVFDAIARQVAEQPTRDLDALTSLLSEVAALATPTVLMLDEAESLPEATARTSLAYLLVNAPPNLHVVIGTRAPVPVPSAELAAHGNWGELSTRDLRLGLDEAVAILNRRFGRRISVDDCARLHEVTEGWPIGLQLAAAAIEREPDLHAAVESLSARRGNIERYFIESLFAGLPPPVGEFLTRIAILDSIEPELCAAVTGADAAGAFLDQLAIETPILIAGELRGWVRIHTLARDFLLARFERLPADERAELHRRAARWLADRNRFHEAGRHALAAGDDELARTFAQRSLWALATEGRLYEARAWIDHMPDETLVDDHLRLLAAWIMSLTGRAEYALAVAESALARTDLPDPLRLEAALVAGCAAAYADRIGDIDRLFAPWQALTPRFESSVHAISFANTIALAKLHEGRTAAIRELLEPQLAKRSSNETLTMALALTRVIVALSHLWDGNLYRVVEVLRGPLAAAERESGRRGVVPGLYAALLSAALLRGGDAAGARAVLADRLDVIERTGIPDAILFASLTLADLASDEGDERAALDALRYLHEVGRARDMPRLMLASIRWQIRVHAFRQHGETINALLADLADLEPSFRRPEFAPYLPEFNLHAAIARAYAALASFDFDAAGRELETAAPIAAALGRGTDALTVRLLRAVVAAQRGEAGAQTLLTEALDLAALQGNVRLQYATHPLVRELAAGRTQTASTPSAAQAPAPAAAAAPGSRPPAKIACGLLTPKEAEVLRLLHNGMSNKLIAKAMDISDETVKWHLKNLFSKLSAGTRRHAVDRARLLGLIAA